MRRRISRKNIIPSCPQASKVKIIFSGKKQTRAEWAREFAKYDEELYKIGSTIPNIDERLNKIKELNKKYPDIAAWQEYK